MVSLADHTSPLVKGLLGDLPLDLVGGLPLNLRHHSFPFAWRMPKWGLPSPGHVVDILTAGGDEVGLVRIEARVVSSGVSGFLNRGFKRVRLTKKTPRLPELGSFGVGNMQPLNIIFMLLWRMGVRGHVGGLLGGFMRVLALETGWMEQGLAN